eukprot:CAMPEP_0115720876 /NCGR_PEP_ID=MMETSP0272-20121206/78779_1 /TAXON_ID=71861 /ORGANISM="Scrippsiella trochoidea, Strain CCMP3099" /LENGTH=256 /DNA_ID=CAMNT_0003163663 /DNA_START=28 /DNA_END=798 /DNA_ORIENTATION=-
MEVASLSVAALGFVCIATSVKKSQDRWAKERSLPRALSDERNGTAPLPVLAVHVLHAEMLKNFHSKRLMLRVKYGFKSQHLRCDTSEFVPELRVQPKISRLVHRQPASQACAELSSTCLFLLSNDIEPILRLSVRRAGIRKCSVAKASVELALLSKGGVADLPLSGPRGEKLGQISIATEVMEVHPSDLAALSALPGAATQRGALLVAGGPPVVEGEVVCGSCDSSLGDDSTPPMVGQPIKLHAGGKIGAVQPAHI